MTKTSIPFTLLNQLSQIFDYAPLCVFAKDLQLSIQYANKKTYKDLKYPNYQCMIGKTAHELWPDFAEQYHRHDLDTLNNTLYYQLEAGRSYTDEKIIGLINKTLLKNEENEIMGILAITQLFYHHDIHRLLTSIQSISGLPIKVVGELNTNKKSLTERESECLFYFLQGKSAKSIGKVLAISPRTVEAHINQIKIKWGCYSKEDVFEKAFEYGYINVLPTSLLKIDFIGSLDIE